MHSPPKYSSKSNFELLLNLCAGSFEQLLELADLAWPDGPPRPPVSSQHSRMQREGVQGGGHSMQPQLRVGQASSGLRGGRGEVQRGGFGGRGEGQRGTGQQAALRGESWQEKGLSGGKWDAQRGPSSHAPAPSGTPGVGVQGGEREEQGRSEGLSRDVTLLARAQAAVDTLEQLGTALWRPAPFRCPSPPVLPLNPSSSPASLTPPSVSPVPMQSTGKAGLGIGAGPALPSKGEHQGKGKAQAKDPQDKGEEQGKHKSKGQDQGQPGDESGEQELGRWTLDTEQHLSWLELQPGKAPNPPLPPPPTLVSVGQTPKGLDTAGQGTGGSALLLSQLDNDTLLRVQVGREGVCRGE